MAVQNVTSMTQMQSITQKINGCGNFGFVIIVDSSGQNNLNFNIGKQPMNRLDILVIVMCVGCFSLGFSLSSLNSLFEIAELNNQLGYLERMTDYLIKEYVTDGKDYEFHDFF